MNNKIWTVEMVGGAKQSITCELCAVSADGSLIGFAIENGNPVAIEGFAPGLWHSFKRSNLKVN